MSLQSVRTSKRSRNIGHGQSQLAEAILGLSIRRTVDSAVLGEILPLIRTHVPFDAATLYLILGPDKGLDSLISQGEQVEPLEFLPLGDGLGLSGWAAYSGEPVLLKDRSRSRHFNPGTDMACFMSLPIPLEEHPLGILNLGSRQAGQFGDDHLKLMKTLAAPLAAVLEKIIHQRTIAGTSAALEDARSRLIDAEKKLSSHTGAEAIAGVMVSLIHEINEQLSVVLGNVERLLIEPAIGNQSVMTRLRRVEEAAVKLRTCSRKLHRLTLRKGSVTTDAT